MAEAGAVVDVVGAEDDAGEFLEEVVVLVEALGGAVDGEGVGAVGVADLGQATGDVVEGLVPGGAAPAAGAAFAGTNEGMGEAVVALGVVPTEAALDAEPALVDGVVLRRHGVGDLAAADVDFEPAADAAEGAGGFDHGVVLDEALFLEFPLGAALEGAGGTDLDAVAAVDAGGVHDSVVLAGGDADVEAAFAGLDGVGELDLVAADVHATPAHDALGVVADVVGVVVDDGQIGAGGRAVGLDVVFGEEGGEVGGFAEVDAGEEGLEGAFAGAADTLTVCEEVLAGFDEGSAGGEELGFAGERGVGGRRVGGLVSGLFDEAKAAVGGGGDVGVVAEGGDVNPEFGGGVEDGGARGHGDRTAVDGERYSVVRRRHAEPSAAERGPTSLRYRSDRAALDFC